MAREINRGHFTEFKRTPQEQKQAELGSRVKVLEERLKKLEDIVINQSIRGTDSDNTSKINKI